MAVTTSLPGKDYALVIDNLGNYTRGEFLNMELLKTVGKTTTRVSEVPAPIRITIQIPESLQNTRSNRVFSLMRVHDGTVTILPDLDEDPATITVETDQFSTYVLIYQDNQGQRGASSETTAPETTAPETTAPETTAPETTAPGPLPPVPQTTAPETTAPETTALETTAPETSASETLPPVPTATETTPAQTTAPETTPVQTAAPETTPAVKETTAAPTTAASTTAAPTAPQKPSHNGNGANTGDSSPITFYIIAAIAALIALAVLGVILARRKK